MADFNYDMFSLGNTAKEKLREVSQEGAVPTGIGAKPADEQEPMDKGFYESMYEAIMSYFDNAEEADKVLTGAKPSRDAIREMTLSEFDNMTLRSAEEAGVLRQDMGKTEAAVPEERKETRLVDVTDTELGKLDNVGPLEELAKDIDPGTIDTNELDADGVQPTDGKGLMSPTLSSTERSALSDRGSEVNISRSYKITDDTDRYSNEQLNQAVDKTVRNPIKKALLAGTIDVEVGDNGPVTEGAGYRLARAYEMFDDSVVNEALASLPEEEQKRIRDGEASNALGMAIFDRRYDGGSAYRGRGLIQITGRSNYQAVQNILQEQGIDIDLVNNPELVNDNRYALPAALAFLEHAGMTDSVAEDMSTKRLNNMINSGANREIAEERWDSVISTLRAAGLDDEADKLELRNEYQAQETVGTTVDGAIGPNSRTAMRSWLQENNITIPEDATDMDLVVLVNRNA